MDKSIEKIQDLHKNWIAYLQVGVESITKCDVAQYEAEIDGKIEICDSWFKLISVLKTRQEELQQINPDDPIVVIIHISSLINSGTTLFELTNMLTTLSKCLMLNCGPVLLGALVDKTCNAELIKQLRSSGFMALIPTADVFGIRKTIEGINVLLQFQVYWDKQVVEVLSGTQKKMLRRNPTITLTTRQQEVMGLICRGLTNKHIARMLNITDSTVKLHVSAIFKLYGVRTRTQLALRGIADSI